MKKLLILAFTSVALVGAAQADHHRGGKHKDRLLSKLELQADQRQAVADILKEQREKRRAIMKPAFEKVKPQMKALRKETRERLAAVLTEDQLQKYDELSSKRGKRMQERMQKRPSSE